MLSWSDLQPRPRAPWHPARIQPRLLPVHLWQSLAQRSPVAAARSQAAPWPLPQIHLQPLPAHLHPPAVAGPTQPAPAWAAHQALLPSAQLWRQHPHLSVSRRPAAQTPIPPAVPRVCLHPAARQAHSPWPPKRQAQGHKHHQHQALQALPSHLTPAAVRQARHPLYRQRPRVLPAPAAHLKPSSGMSWYRRLRLRGLVRLVKARLAWLTQPALGL